MDEEIKKYLRDISDATTLLALMTYHHRGKTNSGIPYTNIGNIGGAIDKLTIQLTRETNSRKDLTTNR